MHEIIHLSLGPQANHVNSQFYDLQSNYFVYTDEEAANSLVDPSVRFVAGKEYTPRAGFWDFRGGFGKRLRYNSNYEPHQTAEELGEQVERLQVLDDVKIQHADLYWAANLKFPLHPKQQFELLDWEFDPIEAPYGKPRGSPQNESANSFMTFAQGQDQYNVVDTEFHHEYLDSTVRRLFEQCDNLSGINILTDFTGWGGFTVGLLEPLRDDFSQKVPVFSWASGAWSLKTQFRAIIDSYLETVLGLTEFSDLVIPLKLDRGSSFAENAEKINLLFETVGVVSSLRKNRVSMATVVQDLTIGSNANIVTGTTNYQDLVPTDLSGEKVESKTGFLRPSTTLSPSQQTSLWDQNLNPQRLVENGTYAHRIHKHYVPQSRSAPDSYLYAELSLNDGIKKLQNLVGFNHDLKVRVLDLVENYRWGYESDSDEIE